MAVAVVAQHDGHKETRFPFLTSLRVIYIFNPVSEKNFPTSTYETDVYIKHSFGVTLDNECFIKVHER